MKRKGYALLALVALALGAAPAFSQQAKKERNIGRIVGGIGGGVAGFMLGYMVSDDDAINSTQKLTRNLAIGAVAGAVGGYFLGRTIDRHIAFEPRLDPQEIQRAQARQVDALVREMGAKLAGDGRSHAVHCAGDE